MWLDKQVSLYSCAADNTGCISTFREILLSQFAINHEYFFRSHTEKRWISGNVNDLSTMIEIRKGHLSKKDAVGLKQTMQCFTPAALLKTKKKDHIEEIHRTGILQLDFDYNDIKEYDIDELKQCVFSLPFIGYCGLSCSGQGFYALALIADPYKLEKYAEHCFQVLLDHGIKADTTKGRNVNDLRFVSYDANFLLREDPTPLNTNIFKTKPKPKTTTNYTPTGNNKGLSKIIEDSRVNGIVNKSLKTLQEVSVGSRWGTVQKVSRTLGGLGINSLLYQIKDTIRSNSAFAGEEDKYFECAEVCFANGIQNPLPVLEQKR